MVGGKAWDMGSRLGGEYIGWVFSHLLQGILRRLPSQCAVCHTWPAQPVCEACVNAFAQPVPRCATCAIEVPSGVHQCGACILAPPPLDACLAALPYAYPWSTLVADFKFHQQPGWAHSFALLLRSTPWVEPALEAADWIIPMPLSRERLRERGYNQALVLAKALEIGVGVMRENMEAATPDTQTGYAGARGSEMQERPSVRAVTGSMAEPAQ